jgi:hypothetical protein
MTAMTQAPTEHRFYGDLAAHCSATPTARCGWRTRPTAPAEETTEDRPPRELFTGRRP